MKSVSDISSALGHRIRKIRKEKGLNQQIVSYTAEINERYLRDIEKGKANPTLQTLISISQALEVELSDFFPQSEEEKSISQG